MNKKKIHGSVRFKSLPTLRISHEISKCEKWKMEREKTTTTTTTTLKHQIHEEINPNLRFDATQICHRAIVGIVKVPA